MTAPLKKYPIRVSVIHHEPVTAVVPPPVVGLNEYDDNPKYPAEPCVWRTFDCDDLPGGKNVR